MMNTECLRLLKVRAVAACLYLFFSFVPVFGQMEVVDLTAPNIIGDSNLNGQPDDGPRVFTIAAKACNRGTNSVRDLFVFVGDGTTPGTFPVAVVPAGAPYLDENYQLAILPGGNPVRFEGKRTLATDECVAFYFPVSYSVVDSSGDALWGKSNTTDDDLPYTFTIWSRATDTVTNLQVAGSLPKTVTVRNQITANPNKVQPNPQGKSRFSLSFPPDDPASVNLAALPLLTGAPPDVAPGETITIYFERPTFGNPNQGFDLDGTPGGDHDLWFQPIGERYWNPTAFRLVKTQASLFGTNCKAGGPTGLREFLIDDLTGVALSVNGGPFAEDGDRPDDVWYIKQLDDFNCSAWDANWYSYTFLAITEGQSRISPYQEVASGRDNEKYSGDYCGDLFGTVQADADYDTPHLVCIPLRSRGTPKLDLEKTVDQQLASPGDTLSYTIQFTNIGTQGIGSQDAGVQVVDAVPADTTFVAASATCSLGASCEIGYSTDGGFVFSQVEPPAAAVTHIRWSVNQTLAPGAMETAGFQVVVDNPFEGLIWNTAQVRIDNGPFLVSDSAHTGIQRATVHLHLFVDDNLNGAVDATDSNGVQDAGEPDLPDVDVEITEFGGAMQTLTSDANGDVWAIVPPGLTSFDVIEATLPPGYVLTTGNEPQNATAVLDSAVNGTDIGYAPPAPDASIGDRVWRDEDGDGVQDPGEAGLNGVTVELRDGICTPGATCPTQVTAGDGDYDFTGLPPGAYILAVINGVPGGFFLTTDNSPSAAVNLSPGEDLDDLDFGYQPVNGALGDFVWADQNGDGVQDPAETGLGGIAVELQDGVCTPAVDCPTRTTDTNGIYLFTDVPPGTYTVDIINPPAGGALTTPPEPRGGITLGQGQVRLDIDFGYTVSTANIGDRVWQDLDGDGIQDAGEPGIDGVTVELTEVEDTTVPGGCTPGLDCPPCTPGSDCPTTVTAGGGFYLFDNGGAGFSPQQYRVQVDESSGPLSGFNVTTASSVVVPLAGGDFLTADFGFAAPMGTVTKHLFEDSNGNGVQDGGEPNLSGVDVEVTDSGSGMQTKTTDAGGNVSFLVPVGSFTCDVVDATLPPGVVLTTANDPHGGSVTDGGTVGANVGYQPRGTLTKHLFEDSNGNGVQDGGEADLAGVTVNVTDSQGVMQSAATNAAGDVSFDVAAGLATCDVNDATLPAGVVLTTANDPHSPNVPSGGAVGANVGYQPRGTLAKHVFQDSNGNGVQDIGEPDLAGVTVNVTDSQGVMQSAATNAAGDVSFDVAAGVATCNVDDSTLPAGFVLTTANDPHSPNVPAGGSVGSNVGYQPRSTLTKHLFEDSNGNGVQDAGEPDLAGVTVDVTDSQGVMQSAATNAAGDVSFDVAAGMATCNVDDSTLPAGFVLTTANDPHSPNVPGGGTVGANVGYQPRGTLTKHLFEDSNGNGVQDAGEPDLAGVTVDVTDSQGVMQSAATNAGGDVSFDVAAGVATCKVDDSTLPAGLALTTGNDPHSPDVPAGGTVGSNVGFQPQPAVLAASKTSMLSGDNDSSGSLTPGDELTYTVTIDNAGPGDALDLTFDDTPDANTSLVVGSVTTSQGVVSEGNGGGDTSVQVQMGTLTAGGQSVITFRVVIDDPLPAGVDQVANQGTVSGTGISSVPTDDPDPSGPADPTIDLLDTGAEVTASKTSMLSGDNDSSGSLTPGDELTYTVTIDNAGPGSASDLLFDDTPDPNTTLVAGSVTTSQGVVTEGNGGGDTSVQVQLGTLVAGSQAVITFRVLVNDPLPPAVTQINNQGTVTGSNITPVSTDDPNPAGPSDPTVNRLEGPMAIPLLGGWGLLLLALLIGAAAIRLLGLHRE